MDLLVSRGSAGGRAFEGGDDVEGPGPVPGQAEDWPAAGGHELPGRAEQAEAQAAGFPEPGCAGQSEHRHPGQQIESDLHDLRPDLVLGGAVQREIPQAGGQGGPDPVLGRRSQPVTELEFGDRPAGRRCWWRDRSAACRPRP